MPFSGWEIASHIIVFSILHSLIYLVYSSGFALLFSVAGLPNLAYSILYTFTAYSTYIILNNFGAPAIVAITASIALTVMLGLGLNEVAVKPVVKVPLSMFISTIAVAYIIEEYFRINYGKSYLTLPRVEGSLNLFGVQVSSHWVAAGLSGLAAIVALHAIISRTRVGVEIRAAAESWEEAYLSGIDPVKTLRVTTVIASIYASIASLSLAPLKAVSPGMGWEMLFTAFAIIVLAGLGSIKGIAAASLIYAGAEQVVTYLASQTIARIVPLAVIIAVLLLKPRGLFGEEVE